MPKARYGIHIDIALLAVLALTWSVEAAARSGVSDKFDGFYAGTMESNKAIGKKDCANVPIKGFSVERGVIQNPVGAPVRFDGYVTEEGFMTGHVTLVGDTVVPFEGRLADAHLVAGVIDESTGCAWILRLQRNTGP